MYSRQNTMDVSMLLTPFSGKKLGCCIGLFETMLDIKTMKYDCIYWFYLLVFTMKTFGVAVYAVVSKFFYLYAKLLPLWGLGDSNVQMNLGAWENTPLYSYLCKGIPYDEVHVISLPRSLILFMNWVPFYLKTSSLVVLYAFFWKIYRRLCIILQVLVVANPANTNALILKEFAPSIPERNISCLTRLDHNRALGQISERLNVQVSDVKNVIIWGNHSSTQYPDVNHATVNTPAGEKPVRELVSDDAWYITNTLNSLPPFIFRRFIDIYT